MKSRIPKFFRLINPAASSFGPVNPGRILAGCLLTCISFLTVPVFSAEKVETRELEEFIDIEDEYSESEDRISFLERLLDNPVNLNTADESVLADIPGISGGFASNIVAYRAAHGPLRSPAELRNVPGYLPGLMESALAFLTVQAAQVTSRPRIAVRTRMDRQLEEPRGIRDGSYPGGIDRQYSRILLDSPGNWEAAFIEERDPGERKWSDFTSGYVKFNGLPEGHSILIGDFHLESGQGLVNWGGRHFGFGGDAVFPVRRKARGILGNRSSLEYGMLRGVALQRSGTGFIYQVFRSWNRWDANRNDNDEITSFYLDGFHRTDLELSKRQNLKEDSYGGYAAYRSASFGRIGLSFNTGSFNKSFINSDRDIFRFTGSNYRTMGMDADIAWKNFNVFGEAAAAKNGSHAFSGGIIFNAGNAQLAVHLRRYDRDFHSIHGSAFGRRSGENRNENGVYVGSKLRLARNWSLSLYLDRFRYPWRTYLNPFPVRGQELMTNLRSEKSKKREFGVKLKIRSQDILTRESDQYGRSWDRIGEESKRLVRFYYEEDISSSFRLISRLDGTISSLESFGAANSGSRTTIRGAFLQEDVRIRIHDELMLYLRIGLFASDKGNADFYSVARDFAGAFSVNRLQGNGQTGGILVTYRAGKNADITIKYTFVKYCGRDAIGSGRDEVTGSVKSRAGIQIDFKI